MTRMPRGRSGFTSLMRAVISPIAAEWAPLTTSRKKLANGWPRGMERLSTKLQRRRHLGRQLPRRRLQQRLRQSREWRYEESRVGAGALETRLLLAIARDRADCRGPCEMEWRGAARSGNAGAPGKGPDRNRRAASGGKLEDISRAE